MCIVVAWHEMIPECSLFVETTISNGSRAYSNREQSKVTPPMIAL